MYKKITHNIVEEHFDHPIGGQIKKSVEKSKLVTNEVFSENKFRTDVQNYFEAYINNLSQLIDASTGTDDDLITAFDNFFKTNWIDNLGNMTKPIYVTEFGERLNESLRSIVTGILLGIQSIRTGKDSGQSFNRIQFSTNDLTQNLTNFNNAWQFPTINATLNGFITDAFNLIKAKISKNTALERQLQQKILSNWSSFEKIFVDGIISQHPERFNKSTFMADTYNKDIM